MPEDLNYEDIFKGLDPIFFYGRELLKRKEPIQKVAARFNFAIENVRPRLI